MQPAARRGCLRLPAVIGRYRVVSAVALVTAIGVFVAWLTWASRADRPEARARVYANFTQCLLTDAAGVNSPSAQAVWAGMQKSSAETAAKSQFLAIPDAAVRGDVITYANTLIARNCDVILAAGPVPVRALAGAAAANPAKHFVLVGDLPSTANTIVVRSAADVASIATVLTDAFHGNFTPRSVGGQ